MAPGGYVWWYLDAFSDDGHYGLTIILFIGSVFSPYYALARRRGAAEPRNHVAVNVALYGRSHRRWAMTERARPALSQSADSLQIGPSLARWENDALIVELDEVAVPIPRRIKGRIRLTPKAVTEHCFGLDRALRHQWWPIAPTARVEVSLEQPGLRWSGDGYLDSNEGSEPLEAGFRRWNWSRAHLSDGSAALLYEPVQRDGTESLLALKIDRQGGIETFDAPPRVRLPRTFWRVGRETRAEAAGMPKVVDTLEDTPFYSRSSLSTSLIEPSVLAMHESLCLDRFDNKLVQLMLPVRMPRRSA